MPKLNLNPPLTFTLTDQYTLEWQDWIGRNHPGEFPWPTEKNLMCDFIKSHDSVFAWTEGKRGSFWTDFLIYEEVCAVVQKKITAGIYEPLNSSYWSQWFCVLKKNGKVLRPVHSLKLLNWVTIHIRVFPISLNISRNVSEDVHVEECWTSIVRATLLT
jgi:hypothetical protein